MVEWKKQHTKNALFFILVPWIDYDKMSIRRGL